MANFLLMQVLDRRYDLTHIVSGSTLTESFALHNFVEELAACRKFHYDVNVTKVDVAFVEFYYIWVVQSPQNFELFL